MDRLSAMQIFSTVMECGSFSAAARKLNKPQTTVSRQVKELEEYLGVQLVLRSTRNLVLTEFNEELPNVGEVFPRKRYLLERSLPLCIQGILKSEIRLTAGDHGRNSQICR